MKKLLLILLCLPMLFSCGEKTNQPLLVNNDEYKSNKDCYIINVSAVKTEESARKKVKKLKNEGYESGFLWIPSFPSLSGAEYYSVFIGPFGTQLECEQATEDYRKINHKAYGLLVSQNSERVEIRGLGKVKTNLSFSEHSDRVLEIKKMYKETKSYEKEGDCKTRSDINLAGEGFDGYVGHKGGKVTKCIYPYSYSRIFFIQNQCTFWKNTEYYFKNGDLYFAYNVEGGGVGEDEETYYEESTRVYFKENGEIEKILIDDGDGNTRVNDRSSIEKIKESVIQDLNFAEKELLKRN